MTERQTDQDAQRILEWTLNFLDDNEDYKVLSDIEPGSIFNSLGKSAPLEG